MLSALICGFTVVYWAQFSEVEFSRQWISHSKVRIESAARFVSLAIIGPLWRRSTKITVSEMCGLSLLCWFIVKLCFLLERVCIVFEVRENSMKLIYSIFFKEAPWIS